MKITSSIQSQGGAAPVVVADARARATSSEHAGKVRESKDASENTSAEKSQRVDAQELKKELNTLNDKLQKLNRSIQFSIDDTTNDVVVKVVDTSSGEVISQIPPDSVLKLRERLEEMAGLLVQKTV